MAILRAQIKEYKTTISRKKKRTIPYDELRQDDVQLLGRNHFRINTYLTIIDKLNNELQKRRKDYKYFCEPFSFINTIKNMKQNEISEKAKKLCQIYKTDTDYDAFEHELLHFRSFLISKYNKEKFTALKLLEIIYKNNLKPLFPNTEIILRIYIFINTFH
jgi:hypothetical protein